MRKQKQFAVIQPHPTFCGAKCAGKSAGKVLRNNSGFSYERHVKAELETALSIITTSYVRSDSIIDAVAENIDYLKPPVRGIFESFLAETTSITPDVQMAIVHLKEKISDTIFEEWCETLQSCQNDRTLKDTLMPVVAKFTDVRLVNSSLKTMLAEARREFPVAVRWCPHSTYKTWSG